MTHIEFLSRCSNLMYEWVMNVRETGYKELLQNIPGGGHGMQLALIILLAVSLIAVVCFYYAIAASAPAANKKNYLITFVLGLITLVLLNYLGVAFCGKQHGYHEIIFLSGNMLKLTIVDLLYYTLLYEGFSLLFKGRTPHGHAENIDLITSLK